MERLELWLVYQARARVGEARKTEGACSLIDESMGSHTCRIWFPPLGLGLIENWSNLMPTLHIVELQGPGR